MATEVMHLREELKELKAAEQENSKKIHELEMAIQRLEIGHKNNIDCIVSNREDIEEIKDRPNRREGQVASAIIAASVTAVIAFLVEFLKK